MAFAKPDETKADDKFAKMVCRRACLQRRSASCAADPPQQVGSVYDGVVRFDPVVSAAPKLDLDCCEPDCVVLIGPGIWRL